MKTNNHISLDSSYTEKCFGRELQKTPKHFLMFSKVFSENRAVYEITWKKYGTVRQSTDGNIIRRMRTACWITKATDITSEHLRHVAFLL